MTKESSNPPHYAAIDLGSNSFHLAIGQIAHGELRWIGKLSEKIQLAASLTNDSNISEDAIERALSCLLRFKDRIAHVPTENLRIVGTNTLRIARNKHLLLKPIKEIFNQKVEIIAGREEARLIYLGVSHSMPQCKHNRLVIDIGGGSTEFIIGKDFTPLQLESLHLGCVTWKLRFFKDGLITTKNFQKAILAAQQEVQIIAENYQAISWTSVIGSSGSARTILNASLKFEGSRPLQGREVITRADLEMLCDYVQSKNHVDELKIDGLKDERKAIFPSGLAILYGIFLQLNIEEMRYSDGALREGLIYDLLGRNDNENTRTRTISALTERYSISSRQSSRVLKTTCLLYKQLKAIWQDIDNPDLQELLCNAAQLHEVGQAMSHTQFHKHGAYIIENSDLAGFSKGDQRIMALLIRLHRRKLSIDVFNTYDELDQNTLIKLVIILRLACVFHQGRNVNKLKSDQVQLIAHKDSLDLSIAFEKGWLNEHPLMLADLEIEKKYLEKVDINLTINETN